MTTDPDSLPLSCVMAVAAALVILNMIVIICNTAMDSVSRSKVRGWMEEEPRDPRAEKLWKLLEKPSRYRYTNNLLSYAITAAGAVLVLLLPYNKIVSVLVFLAVIVSVGEIFPRKLSSQHVESIARKMAGVQTFTYRLLLPVTWLELQISNIFLRMFRQKTDVDEQEFSEDEIMSMLEVGQLNGELREEGKKMIGSIFRFDDELAYEIMTPRTDVFMIDITDPPEEYVDQLMKLRYTRMPVCNGGADDIIGILHIKDYLIKAREEGFDKVDIRGILRQPYFVPETKKIDTLFFELQKEKQHIAILIDEYGGFSGIVTMEDIIEEIVGDIDDEYDEEEESIEKLDEDDYLVDGNTDLDDLNEALGTDLESDRSETIGGYLIDMIGEIPRDGYVNQAVSFERYTFTILSVRERRIEKVRLHIDRNYSPQDEDEKTREEKEEQKS